jgi:hypothetical protein
MRKVVPYVISFTSIFCLKLFEFRKASFGSFQICVSLKNRLIKETYIVFSRARPISLLPPLAHIRHAWPTHTTPLPYSLPTGHHLRHTRAAVGRRAPSSSTPCASDPPPPGTWIPWCYEWHWATDRWAHLPTPHSYVNDPPPPHPSSRASTLLPSLSMAKNDVVSICRNRTSIENRFSMFILKV